MNVVKTLLGLTALALAGGAALTARTRPRAVAVTLPVRKMVTESVAAAGRLQGDVESSVGAQNIGRVVLIPVREGDRVRTGQVIARLDDGVLRTMVTQAQGAVRTADEQLRQAQAGVRTTRAQWEQAARPPLASDMARLRAEVAQNEAVGKARIAASEQQAQAAYQHYQELRNGARPEDVTQAQAQADQAEINLAQQERDRRRQQTLYTEGAIARADYERAETAYQVGRGTLQSAQARLRQVRAGTRVEQIAQAQADYARAQADVAQAQAALTGAHRSGQAQIAGLLALPRPEEVRVAQERVEEARAAQNVASDRIAEARTALALAQGRLSEAAVTAPFGGTVTRIVTQIGAVTSPNTPLIRLVRTGQPEIRVDLDESNLGRLHVGQRAVVTNDAFPDARFEAILQAIGTQVDAERGTVEARLTPLHPPAWVRPGQTFTVNLLLGAAQSRLIVPATAVSSLGGVSSLLVVEGGRVVRKSVRAAPLGLDGVPILEGITSRAQVIVKPDGLAAGDAVRVEKSAGE